MSDRTINSEHSSTSRYPRLEKNSVTTKNISKEDNKQISEIFFCLVPCSECTGVYVDSITGTLLRILCRHKCHANNGRSINIGCNRSATWKFRGTAI